MHLNKYLLTECLNYTLDIVDGAFDRLSRITNNVDTKLQSKDEAKVGLISAGSSFGQLCQKGLTALVNLDCQENGDNQPNAIISKVHQLQFGARLDRRKLTYDGLYCRI